MIQTNLDSFLELLQVVETVATPHPQDQPGKSFMTIFCQSLFVTKDSSIFQYSTTPPANPPPATTTPTTTTPMTPMTPSIMTPDTVYGAAEPTGLPSSATSVPCSLLLLVAMTGFAGSIVAENYL